jgi:Sap-like sulfolipid-1-addressing protein
MNELHKQHLATGATVLVVLAFNMIMLILLELPLLGYAIKPQATGVAVERFSKWLSRNGGRAALIGAVAVGAALVLRGLLNL